MLEKKPNLTGSKRRRVLRIATATASLRSFSESAGFADFRSSRKSPSFNSFGGDVDDTNGAVSCRFAIVTDFRPLRLRGIKSGRSYVIVLACELQKPEPLARRS